MKNGDSEVAEAEKLKDSGAAREKERKTWGIGGTILLRDTLLIFKWQSETEHKMIVCQDKWLHAYLSGDCASSSVVRGRG